MYNTDSYFHFFASYKDTYCGLLQSLRTATLAGRIDATVTVIDGPRTAVVHAYKGESLLAEGRGTEAADVEYRSAAVYLLVSGYGPRSSAGGAPIANSNDRHSCKNYHGPHTAVASLVIYPERQINVWWALAAAVRLMSHLQFCRATLSRDKLASVTWRITQRCNSCATSFPIRAVLCSVQLCRENAVNADWSILIYVTKLQCATCHYHTCDFVVQ